MQAKDATSVAQPAGGVASRTQPVLDVRDLRMYLLTRWGTTKAVDGVSFQLRSGETLGIVGESGCGKSMLALTLVRLTPQPASRVMGGQVLLDGTDLLTLSPHAMQEVRGRKISMILQDPQQSLNPHFTIGNQLLETMRIHEPEAGRKELRSDAVDALQRLRVPEPLRRLKNYPHELSGGLKQRVVAAMAMAYTPQVLIADEPTTALDVTIQAQFLKLLRELQKETGVAIILITHSFGVVAAACDRVAVMYAGRIVEQGPVEDIFDRPGHPYTGALLESLPSVRERIGELRTITGQPPRLTDLPTGCYFAARCPLAMDKCRAQYPPVFEVAEGHTASCWKLEPQS
jgi:oligopeptide/dipeptide ABC transporter ATP-binding protein